jgi:hypothetical protein
MTSLSVLPRVTLLTMVLKDLPVVDIWNEENLGPTCYTTKNIRTRFHPFALHRYYSHDNYCISDHCNLPVV